MLSETAGTQHDFPLVSDRRASSPTLDQDDLATPEQELTPADRLRVWVENVYVAQEQGLDRGDEIIGSVAIAHGRGPDRLPFVALFTFVDGDDTIVVKGEVPGDRHDWNGDGVVEVIDGTGRFGGRQGKRYPLSSVNPKRWG